MSAQKDGSEFHSPFKLQVIIHGAENLPIADLTSSDPFVTITIGGRLEGKTKTLYRSLNPSWNELFNLKLLHRRSVLLLKVFDEDRGKDNDLLGTVAIELRDVVLDRSVQKKYPIVAAGKFDTSSAKLEVSVLIRSNESVIKVVPDEVKTSEAVKEQVLDNIAAIRREYPQLYSSESVFNACTRFITEDNIVYFTESLIKDLLCDITSIFKASNELDAFHKDVKKDFYSRNSLQLINGSKIILGSRMIFWHPPIEKNTLVINLSINDSRSVTFEFYNRFSMWITTRWVLTLHDYWKGAIKARSLPYWASNSTHTFFGRVSTSDGRSFSGRILLSLDRPYEVRTSEETVSLKNMHSVVLSADSVMPKSYIMDVEVVTYSATGVFTAKEKKQIAEESNREVSSQTGLFRNVRKSIRGTIKGVATGVASGVASGAGRVVTGARTIAISNPVNIITSAQSNILAVGKDFRSIINDANNLFGEESAYLSVKTNNVTKRIKPSAKPEHFYVDMNEDSFQRKAIGTFRRDRRTSFSSVQKVASVYPEFEAPLSNMTLLFCHGWDADPAAGLISGQTRLTAEALGDRVDEVFEVPLNANLGFSVTLVRSSGLQLNPPNYGNALVMSTIGAGMHAKLKFTDKDGNSGTLGRIQDFRTPSINPVVDPDWGNFSVVFNAQEGSGSAEFIRVEVCLDDFTTNIVLGTCFIPLSIFRRKSREYTLPLTRFKQSLVNPRDDSVLHSLGTITVQVNRIEEESDSTCVAVLRPSLFECNIYNTRWFCECLAAGSVDSEVVKMVEEFSAIASPDGLELVIERETKNLPQRRKSANTAAASDKQIAVGKTIALEDLNLAADWGEQSGIQEEDQALEIEVEVFENQRRQPYYPFDWSNRAYTRPLYSDLTYAVAFKFETLSAAVPPEHFEWLSEWSIDKTHTQTDDKGWSYGFTFGKILSNHSQGKSVTSPLNTHARRRRWVRRAICRDRSSITPTSRNFEMSNTGKDGTGSGSGRSSSGTGTAVGKAANGSDSTGGGGKAQVAAADALWRDEYLKAHPGAIVAVCEERGSPAKDVLIPWDQVLDATLISDSVLTITVRLHRYFDSGPYIRTFRTTEMEIFVSNCPASELKSIIAERQWFNTVKEKMQKLYAAGNCFGVDDAEYVMNMAKQRASGEVPATEQLSMGAELVADLDESSIALESTIRKLDRYTGSNFDDQKAKKEKTILLRRDLRLRLYMGALFGMKLKGNHQYMEDEIRGIMRKDFQVARSIELNTEIATASNRIEFYLDTTEKRIRDAVLCGWDFRGGQLERCLEIFANGYFIEIVGLLGMFFEANSGEATKGLGNKVELIHTYMKHNDRLATILDHALRPYALKAKPDATLSLFLDFEILASWYTSVLLIEMRGRVDDVLAVWTDVSKDVTGNSVQYEYPVPWVPQRAEVGTDLYFYTSIAEDLVEILITYLNFARIRKETVAVSFRDSIGRLDAEVMMAYTSAFLYLADKVHESVNSKDWSLATEADELEEYSTWLASVANDAHRIVSNKIFSPEKMSGAAQEGEEFDKSSTEGMKNGEILCQRAIREYEHLQFTALDHFSCIVFSYVFHDRMELLTKQLYYVWAEALLRADTADSAQIIPAIMEDVTFFLEGGYNFLNKHAFRQLISIVADKLVVMYFTVLKIAVYKGCEFGEDETVQFANDVEAMRQCVHSAISQTKDGTAEYDDCAAAVHSKFEIFDHCYSLLRNDLASATFDSTMKTLQVMAEAQPQSAMALAALIEVVLGLKGVEEYVSKKHHKREKKHKASEHQSGRNQSHRRGSAFSYAIGTMFQSAGGGSAENPERDGDFSDIREEVDDNDEDEDGEDAAVQEEMMRVKEKAILECIIVMIDKVKSYYQVSARKHRSLSHSSPLVRVFGETKYALEVQLLHSARPREIAPSSYSALSIVDGIGSAFTGLFSSTIRANQDSHYLNHQTSSPLSSSPISPRSSVAITKDLGMVIISELKVNFMFYLDSLRNPHPFLRFQYGSFVTQTKVISADTTADWSTEEPITIRLNEACKGIAHVTELVVSLHYQGYLSAQLIGSVKIPFPALSPPLLKDRQFTIEDYSRSPQAAKAAKAAKDDGRFLPTVTISAMHIQHA